jgi:hypothetical protein
MERGVKIRILTPEDAYCDKKTLASNRLMQWEDTLDVVGLNYDINLVSYDLGYSFGKADGKSGYCDVGDTVW